MFPLRHLQCCHAGQGMIPLVKVSFSEAVFCGFSMLTSYLFNNTSEHIRIGWMSDCWFRDCLTVWEHGEAYDINPVDFGDRVQLSVALRLGNWGLGSHLVITLIFSHILARSGGGDA